jgi:hypothetical protein
MASGLALALVAVIWPVSTAAAQEVAVEETVLEPEDFELRRELLERYEVVVLSRGLLLTALDPESPVRMIEIGEAGLAADGEVITADDLRDRLGESDTNLVLQLAELGEARGRRLIEEEVTDETPTGIEVTFEDPEDREKPQRRRKDTQVVFGSSLTVEADEVAREAVVFGAPLTVYGKVTESAAAIGGPVTIEGEVVGDVLAVGGSVYLKSGAEVLGDVVSVGGTVEREADVRVTGEIVEVPFGSGMRLWPGAGVFRRHADWHDEADAFRVSPLGVATEAMWEVFCVVIVALLACLVLLLARRPLERMERKIRAEPLKAGLVGLVTQILCLPLLVLVILILVISIIGIPLLLLIPFALVAIVLLAFVGYCAFAMRVGNFLEERFSWQFGNPYLVLIVGVVAVQSFSLIGELLDFGWGPLWFFAVMFAIFGGLIEYIAWTEGLGAAILTRFGTSDGWGDRGDAATAPLPAAPAEAEEAGSLPAGGADDELPQDPGSEPFQSPESNAPQ